MEIKKELIQKFRDGSPLSDFELLEVYRFYADLAAATQLLGPKYQLFWRDSLNEQERIRDFLVARNSDFTLLKSWGIKER